MISRPQTIQLLAAALVLTLGVLVYLFDRPASATYFIPDWWPAADETEKTFGRSGRHLPTFAHVYAFILLTTAVTGARRRLSIAGICVAWFIVEAAFEIGQIDSVATRIIAVLPEWSAAVPVLENLGSYFVNGSFDSRDLLSILIGALAAYATARLSFRWAATVSDASR